METETQKEMEASIGALSKKLGLWEKEKGGLVLMFCHHEGGVEFALDGFHSREGLLEAAMVLVHETLEIEGELADQGLKLEREQTM